MDKVRFKATVYREGEIPLRDGGEPVVSDDAPEPEYTRLHIWGFVALLWCIVFVSILGAAYITLRLSAPLPAAWPPSWPECALGSIWALLLFAITLFVRRMARREEG